MELMFRQNHKLRKRTISFYPFTYLYFPFSSVFWDDGIQLDGIAPVYHQLCTGGVPGVGSEIIDGICNVLAVRHITDGCVFGGYIFVKLRIFYPAIRADHTRQNRIHSNAILTKIQSQRPHQSQLSTLI